MKARIFLRKKLSSKLLAVKAIKIATGLGLKAAKDIIDHLSVTIGTPMDIDVLSFIGDSGNLKIEMDGVSYLINEFGKEAYEGNVCILDLNTRDVNLLRLGLGETEEYVDYMSNKIINFKLKVVLEDILNKLDKEELIELIKNFDESILQKK